MKRWIAALRVVVFTLILGSAAASAMAQARAEGARSTPPRSGLRSSTVVFGFVGIVMTILGFKMFDALIKFNLAEEICEKQNIAAALPAAPCSSPSIIIAVAVLETESSHARPPNST